MATISPEIASFVSESISNSTDSIAADLTTTFVLNSSYYVFFMHCGFAMLSIGCVRARFAKHIAILILVDACTSALAYYIFGYGFAYGDHDEDGTDHQNSFIGSRYFAMSGLPHSNFHSWIFQWTFAATACTIVSGAIAERAKFETYVLYSFFMSAWVYPIITHSVWSTSGWAGMFRSAIPTTNLSFLVGSGAIDFAGSGAVHMVGGVAAAVGCHVIGPRIGRFLKDGRVVNMPGHNTSLFVLGVLILWYGWYGFNPGSQLAVLGVTSSISNAAVTTTLSPSAAGMSALFFKSFLGHRSAGRITYDVGVMGNGALAGLVAITAGCSTVEPWGAICIGFVAGLLYVLGSYVSIKLRLDDPLDAIAVHAWNGLWGVIAVGFFASEGLVNASYGTNPYNGWVAANMIPFWYLLKYLGFLRVPAAIEAVGLDDSYHGGSAYPGQIDNLLNKSVEGGNTVDLENNDSDMRVELFNLRNEVADLRDSLNQLKSFRTPSTSNKIEYEVPSDV